MATFDTTPVTTGASGRGLSPFNSAYVQYRLIKVDVASVVADKNGGTSLANGDIIQIMDVPAGTKLIGVDAKVTEAGVISGYSGGTTSASVDIDVAGGDSFVDGGDITSTGYLAPGTNGAITDANAVRVTSDDTLDVTINVSGAGGSGTAVLDSGKIDVWVAFVDLEGQLGTSGIAQPKS